MDEPSEPRAASLGRELSALRRGSQDVVHGHDSPCPVFIRS